MRQWALQDAKARLREMIRLAAEHEPQEITRCGEPSVAMLARADYDALDKPRGTLVELIRRSPLYGADDLEFSHDRSLTREIDL